MLIYIYNWITPFMKFNGDILPKAKASQYVSDICFTSKKKYYN